MNEHTPPRGTPRRSNPRSAAQPHPPHFGELIVPTPPEDDTLLPLADDAPPRARTQTAAEREALLLASAVCPSCESNFPPEAVLCVKCGFDRRTRARINAPLPKERAEPIPEFVTVDCPRCGTDLDPFTTTTCPECGEEFTPGHLKRFAKRKKAAREQLQLWITPTIIVAIASLVCIIHIVQLGGVNLAGIWGVGTGLSILGGFCGFALAAKSLTGWSYDFGNSLLRIFAILMIVAVILTFIPIPLPRISSRRGTGQGLPWLPIWAILAVLQKLLMDMDFRDSFAASGAMTVGWIIGSWVSVFVIAQIF